jgi:hypothetical protein
MLDRCYLRSPLVGLSSYGHVHECATHIEGADKWPAVLPNSRELLPHMPRLYIRRSWCSFLFLRSFDELHRLLFWLWRDNGLRPAPARNLRSPCQV